MRTGRRRARRPRCCSPQRFGACRRCCRICSGRASMAAMLSHSYGGAPALGSEEAALLRRKSVNTTECVPVPSSEHVAEIVGRQGNAAWGHGGTRGPPPPSRRPPAIRGNFGALSPCGGGKLTAADPAAPKVGRGSRELRSAPVPPNCLEMAIELHRPGWDHAGCPRKVPGSHASPWELPGHGARRELWFHCSCASAPSPPAPYLRPGV